MRLLCRHILRCQRGKSIVARMEPPAESGKNGHPNPDCASLHPGYNTVRRNGGTPAYCAEWIKRANGIKVLDALHLACAVEAHAKYFCTCDDRFYRRAKQLDTKQTLVVSPLELIEVIEP